MKAMATKKGGRYKTVEALIEEVRAYQEGFATRAEDAGFVKSLLLFVKRHRFGSFFLLSVFLTSLLLGALIKRNELRVRSALRLYKTEKLEKERNLLEASPELIKNWQSSLESTDLEWLHSQLDDIIRLDPQHEDAVKLKCYVHLLEFDFYKAIKLSSSISNPKSHLGFLRAKKIAEICLNDFIRYGYVLPDTALGCSKIDNFVKFYPKMSKMFLAAVFKRLKTDREKSYLVMKVLERFGNRGINW